MWIYALVEILIFIKPLRQKDFQQQKDDLLKAAQVAWLTDEHAEAERLLRTILRMDDRDVEAWIHLGKVLKSVGREAESRVAFRSALNLDGSERWRWTLLYELGEAHIHESANDVS